MRKLTFLLALAIPLVLLIPAPAPACPVVASAAVVPACPSVFVQPAFVGFNTFGAVGFSSVRVRSVGVGVSPFVGVNVGVGARRVRQVTRTRIR